MIIDNMIAYAQVDALLDILEDKYRQKVPEKVRNFFKEEKIKDYEIEIDTDKPLTEQGLKRETMVLLAILNINYWCETEEEKQEWINELVENEQEKKKLEEKYNPNNLLKNTENISTETIENTKNIQLVEYKEKNIIQKIIDKIKKMFKRK